MRPTLALTRIHLRMLPRNPLAVVLLCNLALFAVVNSWRRAPDGRMWVLGLWLWGGFYAAFAAAPQLGGTRPQERHPALPARPRQRRWAVLLATAASLLPTALVLDVVSVWIVRGAASVAESVVVVPFAGLVALSGVGIGALAMEYRQSHPWTWMWWLIATVLIMLAVPLGGLRDLASQAILGAGGLLLAIGVPSARPRPGGVARAAAEASSTPARVRSVGRAGGSPVAAYWRLQARGGFLMSAALGAGTVAGSMVFFLLLGVISGGGAGRPALIPFTLILTLLFGAVIPGLPLPAGPSPLLRIGEVVRGLPLRPWDAWVHGLLAAPIQVAGAGLAGLIAMAPVAWLLGTPMSRGDLIAWVVGFPGCAGIALLARGVYLGTLLHGRWVRPTLLALLAVAWLPLPMLAMPQAEQIGLPRVEISLGIFAVLAGVAVATGPRRRAPRRRGR